MPILNYKPKIMLHYILPPNTSGPNISMSRIENSWLCEHFDFGQLIQDEIPGRSINIKLLLKMIKQIRSFDPDVVHVSGLQLAGLYAVIAARIAGYKNVITTVHGSSVDAIGFHPIFKGIFRYIIEPITMYMSKGYNTVCMDMSKKYKINRKKNFEGVIYNPAPDIQLKSSIREFYREKLCVSVNKTVFCFTGRMTYDKGISFYIEAIKKIKDPNAVFLFVGDGPYYEIVNNELNNEISDNTVINLGKRSDVLEILQACDVFVFPSLHENLSNSLLEACSVGLAVIATSVGGNKEIIINERNGLLISPQNSNAIMSSIQRLLNNKNEIRLFGDASKLYMMKNFSEEKIFAKLMKLYNKVLGI